VTSKLLLDFYAMNSVLAAEIALSRKCALGILDFRYAPYSLGDIFTWLTNIQVQAHGMPIDLVLVSLPEKSTRRHQAHIISYNRVQVIEGLLPAYLTCPSVVSFRMFENKNKFSQRALGALLARATSWPTLMSHLRGLLDPSSHTQINAFYAKNKWLPRLQAPPGFRDETQRFRAAYLNERVPIVINIRQRALTHNPHALFRDSSADAWYEFLMKAESRWPKAIFVLVGGFSEWERRFARLANVIIPRMLGLGLGHELTLLFEGAPFFGTSSGFSAAATFSNTPYTITNIEHQTDINWGIPVGTEQHPFALAHQWLNWQYETEPLLSDLFERLWITARQSAP
jgi:hypothetical protein